MNTTILKRLWLATMFMLLLVTAPHWLNSTGQDYKPGYDAPWIHPALAAHN